MLRLEPWGEWGLAALALALLLGCPSQRPARRSDLPNVLLISVDTLRADHTSAYGYERDTTPYLRRLADQGTRIELAYSATSTTSPTHATLFTGLSPIRHGLTFNGAKLDPKFVTLAEIFRDAGYHTGAVVSSFVMDHKFGFAQGFERYRDDFGKHSGKFKVDRWEGHEIAGGFDIRADETTRRAADWLTSAQKVEAPFFLFVHYFEPHEWYLPPPPYDQQFGSAEAGIDTRERDARLYDGEIAYTDREIGRLIEHLDLLFDSSRTLVVVTADHGQGLMDHGDPFHSVSIYEEDVRVPLIFRSSGRIDAGRVVRGPIGVVDIAPTLIGLAGLADSLPATSLPADSLPAISLSATDGVSFADVLTGSAWRDTDRPIFLLRQFYRPGTIRDRFVAGEEFGVRLGDWKYILGPAQRTRLLFNLAEDPRETRNLAEFEKERSDELEALVAAWRTRERAPLQTPEDLSGSDREALRTLGYID